MYIIQAIVVAECEACGNETAKFTASGPNAAKDAARKAGWVLRDSDYACFCPECVQRGLRNCIIITENCNDRTYTVTDGSGEWPAVTVDSREKATDEAESMSDVTGLPIRWER